VSEQSGLRNPAAAVRGVGAAALSVEALVLLLAVAPLVKLGGHFRGAAVAVVVVLAVVTIVFVGMLRRGWVWYAAGAIPVVLILATALHWSLGVLGVVFGLVWLYVLYVRRSVLRGGSGAGADGDADATGGSSNG
jgi:hypothetical protein